MADGTTLSACDRCRLDYGEKEPPCETCWVDLMPENEDAIRIFNLVRYQLVMASGGAVDLLHEAIHRAMELYQVRNRRECFEKVLTLGRWWIPKVNEKKGDE